MSECPDVVRQRDGDSLRSTQAKKACQLTFPAYSKVGCDRNWGSIFDSANHQAEQRMREQPPATAIVHTSHAARRIRSRSWHKNLVARHFSNGRSNEKADPGVTIVHSNESILSVMSEGDCRRIIIFFFTGNFLLL